MQDFKKVIAWQRAHQLTLAIYRQTEQFPDSEKYGLTSQIRCAAMFIPTNIAEGCGRNSQKELANFLNIAIGLQVKWSISYYWHETSTILQVMFMKNSIISYYRLNALYRDLSKKYAVQSKTLNQ